jgi:hypothetical protein
VTGIDGSAPAPAKLLSKECQARVRHFELKVRVVVQARGKVEAVDGGARSRGRKREETDVRGFGA